MMDSYLILIFFFIKIKIIIKSLTATYFNLNNSR